MDDIFIPAEMFFEDIKERQLQREVDKFFVAYRRAVIADAAQKLRVGKKP